MPIIFEKQITAAKKLAVWHITEPLDFFLGKLNLVPDAQASKKRQLENAVCALLLDELGQRGLHQNLARDLFGKPYITNAETSISFSHSRDMVACILDTSGHGVGVDIELMRERILALSAKFINRDDYTPFREVMHAHLIWGAKEVLYKIYSKKELDFICHMTVKFDEKYHGLIHKNEVMERHELDFTEINNFILVWNI